MASSIAGGPSRDLAPAPPTALVMNLFYTGLGICRSLGERGVPVIGLSAHRGNYGNFSRFCRTVACADSQQAPEALRDQLLALGKSLGHRGVLFPTRDHDLVFLERFRGELERYFSLVIPPSDALGRCLNKWDTYLAAVQAGVPTPKCWLVEDGPSLDRAADEIAYPCVLKPLAAHQWRMADNWELVGGRKAISIGSREQLLAEYGVIARAERRVLIQEQVPGGDDCLVIAACYVDRQGQFQAGFNTQKLVQTPPGFGTGCIVQSADRPELFERTIRLLRAIGFSGIAEVEYKWDQTDREYKLIEVNPRPWDQHRLGAACGVDLAYLAYCDHAGRPAPEVHARYTPQKWVAEDAMLMAVLRLVWRREPGVRALLRQAGGSRQYGIWSASDPLPFIAYVVKLVPGLAGMGFAGLRRLLGGRSAVAQSMATREVQ